MRAVTKTPIPSLRTILSALLAAALTACASAPEEMENYEPPETVQPVYESPTGGAIYQSATNVRLFEDLRAGRVGDILTVRLTEQTNASKNSATSTSKSTQSTLVNPTVFGRPITQNGTPLFDASLDGEQAFDGAGTSSQSNSLQGDITVTVVARYPNGNLRIRGEKWVMLNQGKEYIRLSGIVRPVDIAPDNSVPSTKIADAEIAYSSKGVLAAANRMGLISRFFHSILHPY